MTLDDVKTDGDKSQWMDEFIVKCSKIGTEHSLLELKEELNSLFDQIDYLQSIFK